MKDLYRDETNEDVYSEEYNGKPSGSYSDDYVKWLEKKLTNSINNEEKLVNFQKNNLLNFKNWETEKCKLPWDASPEQIVNQYIDQNIKNKPLS